MKYQTTPALAGQMATNPDERPLDPIALGAEIRSV